MISLESCRLRRSEDIYVFTDEFHCSTNFMPGDEVICDSFQPFLFEIWRWLPYMPRHCEDTLHGTVKCHVNFITAALTAVREVKSFEVGKERVMFREEDNILSLIQVMGRKLTEDMML
ncbi:hypothetical protein AVEN_37966-1 [Araneus ventricosus]|uniref:Uncharacterized protein n=1 Tax=Araneus ventricosus TaxID=182803 RepID=A0A4Y2PTQ1_ARAVE|nr:hypothetical protein AVEN_37966-1 [Araneus ventricosus]